MCGSLDDGLLLGAFCVGYNFFQFHLRGKDDLLTTESDAWGRRLQHR